MKVPLPSPEPKNVNSHFDVREGQIKVSKKVINCWVRLIILLMYIISQLHKP